MTLIQVSMATPLLLNGGVSFRPLIPFLYTHPLPACKSIRNFKTNTNIKIRTSSSILVVRGASQVDAAQPSTSDKQIVPDSDLSITKISFGVVGLAAGTTLLSYGFGAYFNILPGSEWSALMLTYGFPLAIIGMALKYAELKPVPCITYSDALALRETKATPVLNQVRKDVARFRYGDEQHLDEALKRIFRYGQGGGIQRRNAPVLSMIREELTAEGKYSLVLVFEAKALQLTDFEQRRAKFASFFGPGVTAEVGAHSIGVLHCSPFSANMLYNFSGTGHQDPSMDPRLASALKDKCPKPNSNSNSEPTVPLDLTPTRLDEKYYLDLQVKRGVLTSDQALM